jgi:hypothetical protein
MVCYYMDLDLLRTAAWMLGFVSCVLMVRAPTHRQLVTDQRLQPYYSFLLVSVH